MTAPLQITPETKVAALLEVYPELEEVLIGLAPPFAKLRNPVLRRTVARVTSLRRAAEVGGLSPRELVSKLRDEAGLEPLGEGRGDDAAEPATDPPEWYAPGRVAWQLDADELLAAGREPLSEVGRRLAELGTDQAGLIASSFRPAPLIEWLEGRGLEVACWEDAAAGFRTAVRAPA